MLILALDTTTRAGSVALLRNHDVLHERSGDATLTHGQRLPGDLMEACAGAGVRIEEIELFAVAAGPGSFTGLRIGIAAMQGLAMARGRRIVPVSTLEAIAVAVPAGVTRVVSWMDAQRGQVFAQIFEREGAAARPLTPAVAALPGVVLQQHGALLRGTTFAGDGALRYEAEIHGVLGGEARIAGPARHLAVAIARIAADAPERAVLPHAVVPLYVRKSDAEIARDRRAGA